MKGRERKREDFCNSEDISLGRKGGREGGREGVREGGREGVSE